MTVRSHVPVAEVLGHIHAHPEQHEQTVWSCGTTACVAGRACLLAGYEPASCEFEYCSCTPVRRGAQTTTCCVRNPDTGQLYRIASLAQQLMHISDSDAESLFDGGNEVEDLDHIAARILRERAS
jgi:hypothetical protein